MHIPLNSRSRSHLMRNSDVDLLFINIMKNAILKNIQKNNGVLKKLLTIFP